MYNKLDSYYKDKVVYKKIPFSLSGSNWFI